MKWLDVHAAAEHLGCHAETVRRACRNQELRYYKPSKKLLFKREWLDQFVERKTFDPLPMLARYRRVS